MSSASCDKAVKMGLFGPLLRQSCRVDWGLQQRDWLQGVGGFHLSALGPLRVQLLCPSPAHSAFLAMEHVPPNRRLFPPRSQQSSEGASPALDASLA